jgi:hypothetical protein
VRLINTEHLTSIVRLRTETGSITGVNQRSPMSPSAPSALSRSAPSASAARRASIPRAGSPIRRRHGRAEQIHWAFERRNTGT